MTEVINKMAQLMSELNQINVHGREDIIHMAQSMGILEEVMKCLLDIKKQEDNKGDKK